MNDDPRADTDYVHAREKMVASQLAARGITDHAVLKAMGEIPRHVFVTEPLRPKAYNDVPLSIGFGQTISQPYMVALMTELLHLGPEDCVLEVGTGSGYQAAILAALSRSVVTLERQADLAEKARANLKNLGIQNVRVLHGDGSGGYPQGAPYDAIIVTAGGPRVPSPLIDQLAVDGRLVCPVGDREAQLLVRVRRTPEGTVQEEGISCRFVPLIGKHAWTED